ncbi:GTP-binding protein [Tepidimicrobium xylanilyticum]
MENKTKLYLLTGFLESGKTTFLTNVLNDLKGSKVAVIMNEFDKVGIDGIIIQRDVMDLVLKSLWLLINYKLYSILYIF